MDKMSQRFGLNPGEVPRARFLPVGILVLCSLVGCSNPVSKMMFTNHKNRNPAMAPDKQRERGEEEGHRANYLATRSSDDLDWLMRNRIQNGLTLSSVNNILGQKGKPTEEADGIAQAGGSSGGTDGTYQYGPDDRGQMYRLTFRNSRLVDFNPAGAAEPGSEIGQSSQRSKLNSGKKVEGRVSLGEDESLKSMRGKRTAGKL